MFIPMLLNLFKNVDNDTIKYLTLNEVIERYEKTDESFNEQFEYDEQFNIMNHIRRNILTGDPFYENKPLELFDIEIYSKNDIYIHLSFLPKYGYHIFDIIAKNRNDTRWIKTKGTIQQTKKTFCKEIKRLLDFMEERG